MKLKNKLGCIILRDFNFYTLIIIIMLFLFYIYTLPYIAEYEEITNYSQKAYLINSVVDNLYFSSNFWHSPLEYLKDIPPILLFFLIILASLLNFLTTVYTLSFILTIIVNTTRCFKVGTWPREACGIDEHNCLGQLEDKDMKVEKHNH